MGFDIYWSLHRAAGLRARERDLAAAHVARWRNRICHYDLSVPEEVGASVDGLVAWNTLRPSHGDPRRSDHGGYLLDVIDDVLEALTELRELFEGVELAVSDDFSTYAWDDDHWEPFSDDARAAESPEHGDLWRHVTSLPAVPQPAPLASAPLFAASGDERAIAAALRSADEAVGRKLAVTAAWVDALAARLAIDGWEPRPWTAEVLATIVALRGRSAWRGVALAADAGLDGGAAALGVLVDQQACVALDDGGHPAWSAFAAVVGHPQGSRPEGSDELTALARVGHAIAVAGNELTSVPRLDDNDYKPGRALPAAVGETLAALADVARPLGLELDETSDDIDDVDNALDELSSEVLRRLAPFLVGAFESERRRTWRSELLGLAVAAREPLDLKPERVDVPREWTKPSPPVPEQNITTGLARLGEAARIASTPPPPPSPWRSDEADDLLTMVCKRDTRPDAAHTARLGIPEDFARASWSDQDEYLERRLAALEAVLVVQRVLARFEELLPCMALERVFRSRIAEAARHPDVAARMVQAWDEAFAGDWNGVNSLGNLFSPAADSPAMFQHVLDEIGAPDRHGGPDRTSASFDVLRSASERSAEAAAALVARARADRMRPDADWRYLTYAALRHLAPEEATPTAILELAQPHAVREAEALLILIARDAGVGITMLERAVDLPHLAVAAAQVLRKVKHAGVEPLRRRWLEHPYWAVRLAAARSNRDGETRRAELVALWKQIDQAGITMSADERSRDAPDGPVGRPVELARLPPLATGLASTCADYRRAVITAVDARRDPADAAALVYADELDRALQRRGHRRTAPTWWHWRGKLRGLPLDRRARLAWAAAQPGSLPDVLVRVREDGGEMVAASFPPPHLVLSFDERAALEAAERPVADRGDALLWS